LYRENLPGRRRLMQRAQICEFDNRKQIQPAFILPNVNLTIDQFCLLPLITPAELRR
jgi:hypothetical protein